MFGSLPLENFSQIFFKWHPFLTGCHFGWGGKSGMSHSPVRFDHCSPVLCVTIRHYAFQIRGRRGRERVRERDIWIYMYDRTLFFTTRAFLILWSFQYTLSSSNLILLSLSRVRTDRENRFRPHLVAIAGLLANLRLPEEFTYSLATYQTITEQHE